MISRACGNPEGRVGTHIFLFFFLENIPEDLNKIQGFSSKFR